MTIGLQITDGTTTVDLNDGSYFEVMSLELGYGDVSQPWVTGSARLYIDGTKAQIQTELAALQKLMQASIMDSGAGFGGALYDNLNKRIYLNYRTDSTETYYRSRLIRCAYTIETAGIEALNFDCGGIEIILDFMRYNWWEGALTQILLTNHMAYEAVGPCPVYNPTIQYTSNTISFDTSGTEQIRDTLNGLHPFKVGDTIIVAGSTDNDGTYTVVTAGVGTIVVSPAVITEAAGDTVTIAGAYCDYVTIPAAAVTGDLPAACRIELTSTYTSADNLYDVYIGHNYTNPTTLTHILEFEDSTEAAGGTKTATYSKNYYYNPTITSGTEQIMASWPLTPSQVTAAAGRFFRGYIFGNLLNTSNPRYRLKIAYGAGQDTIWEGQQYKVAGSDYMYDLGIFKLPPSLAGLTGTPDTLYLEVWIYQNSGSSKAYAPDYLKMLPIDGYYLVTSSAFGIDTNQRMVIDGLEGFLYKDNGAGTGQAPILTSTGAPIMLQPGRQQRLYFTQKLGTVGSWDIEQTMGVMVYYRPRRLSL